MMNDEASPLVSSCSSISVQVDYKMLPGKACSFQVFFCSASPFFDSLYQNNLSIPGCTFDFQTNVANVGTLLF